MVNRIGGHLWFEIRDLICVGHLIRSKAVANLKIIQKNTVFCHNCDTCSDFLYNDISTMTLKLGAIQTKSLEKYDYIINLFCYS